ncbi:MAG: GNAT family N-acetyltransferase [Oscillospiraceae bacterium]|nr:GNAT family N-acetyltransferase [Oscillospiraceae bacterium]
MSVNTILLTDFTDPRFRAAFQAYFAELKIPVQDWDSLFQEMNDEGTNRAYLLPDRWNGASGFLQFQLTGFSNWFFTEPFGFIREFWVAPALRRRGYGSLLLDMAERYFVEHGAYRALLTADDAVDFYLARGYRKAPGVTAKNDMEVLTKTLR